MNTKSKWFKLLIKLDRKCNVIFAPILNKIFNVEIKFGNPNHTISTVFALNRKHCKLCGFACIVLGKIDNRHCEESYRTDLKRIRKIRKNEKSKKHLK